MNVELNMKMDYENLCLEFERLFPEWVSSNEYNEFDREGIYIYFFSLTRFICDLIKKKKELGIVDRYFIMLNEMIEEENDPGDRISTLAVIEGLESLVQDKEIKDFTITKLRSKGLEYLPQVLKFTGVQD